MSNQQIKISEGRGKTVFLLIKTAYVKRPKGQDQIWWLISKENKPWVQTIAPFVFLAGFTAIFGLSYGNYDQALSMALALILQMYCHEQGHAFIFRISKIACKVLWLLPLGAVAAPVNREEDARSDRLPWFTIACLTQAGITANVLLMAVGVGLHAVAGNGWFGRFGQDLVMMGGVLAITNLFPVWQLDAKLLFKVIFSSLDELADRRFSITVSLIVLLVVAAAILFGGGMDFWTILIAAVFRFGWILALFIMIAGMWHQQGIDDPTYAASPQAMTRIQAVIHMVWYICLLYISLRLTVGPLFAVF
jgi:hypothetical protein